jgi:AcrR family transcriptional regulator
VTPSSANRQAPRREKTRLALIAAGRELLAERAIDGIPVDDIVERAGVAKGSFFNHFKDKDAFAGAIAAEIRLALEGEVARVNAGVDDPALRVVRGVASFVRFALADGRGARILMRGRGGAAAADHPLNDGVRLDIARGLAEGRLAAPSLDAGVLYVVGLCQVLLAAVVLQALDRAPAGRLTAEMLALLLVGLGLSPGEAEALASETAADLLAPA